MCTQTNTTYKKHVCVRICVAYYLYIYVAMYGVICTHEHTRIWDALCHPWSRTSNMFKQLRSRSRPTEIIAFCQFLKRIPCLLIHVQQSRRHSHRRRLQVADPCSNDARPGSHWNSLNDWEVCGWWIGNTAFGLLQRWGHDSTICMGTGSFEYQV